MHKTKLPPLRMQQNSFFQHQPTPSSIRNPHTPLIPQPRPRPPKSPKSTNIPPEELPNILQILVQIPPTPTPIRTTGLPTRTPPLCRRHRRNYIPRADGAKPVHPIPRRVHDPRRESRRVEAALGTKPHAAQQRCGAATTAAERTGAEGGGAGADGQRGEEGAVEGQLGVRGRLAVGVEEVDEGGLLALADALEVEDLAEVCVGAVGDVDEVGLDEGFWGRGAHLERLEEGVEFGEGLVDAFDEAMIV